MSTNTREVTDATFEETVKKSDGLALVDFWAEWCGPCRMVAPLLDELAAEYAERVTVYKLDVDANPDIATTYKVRSIPSILFFKGGSVVDTVIGAVPKSKLKEKIDQHL